MWINCGIKLTIFDILEMNDIGLLTWSNYFICLPLVRVSSVALFTSKLKRLWFCDMNLSNNDNGKQAKLKH